MFEPNSIKSLLTRKQSARLQNKDSKEEKLTKVYDPEYQVLVQNKLLLKDIDHQVDSIREWRQHHNALVSEKLKFNDEVRRVQEQEHEKYLKKEEQRDNEEKEKILKKLQVQAQIKIVEEDQAYDSQKIMMVLSETDNIREKIKNNQSVFTVNDQHQAFLQSFQHMPTIFKKQYNADQEEKEKQVKLNSNALKSELDEIERELEEIEDLLK